MKRLNKTTHQEDRSESGNDFFETHPNKLQFITNITLIIITVLALLSSSYFSYKNLIVSTAQFETANKQFNYQRKVDSLNKIAESLKELKVSKQVKNDSIAQAQKDKTQSNRNKLQDELNRKQIQINSEQLSTTKSQARTASKQFDQQLEQYKQQAIEKKPYFMIDNISIDSTVKYKPRISFIFSNKGLTRAHVDSTVLSFSNVQLGCYSVTPNIGNIDAAPQLNTLNTSYINIYNDCLKSESTIFYLIIYYRDFVANVSKHEAIFFQFRSNKGQFVYYQIPLKLINREFKDFLNKKKILVSE